MNRQREAEAKRQREQEAARQEQEAARQREAEATRQRETAAVRVAAWKSQQAAEEVAWLSDKKALRGTVERGEGEGGAGGGPRIGSE